MSHPADEITLNTTDLAIERSRMAAERTLMAWVRTSLSMISFGFTIFKFFQYMQESKAIERWEPTGALHMGSTLVVLGTLILVPAVLQHWLYLRHLREQAREKLPISLAQIVAALITALGLAALANLFLHLGPF